MTATAAPIVKCPVCKAHGDMLHQDLRAPLVYSCKNCLHEWEIDPAHEPAPSHPAPAERRRTPSARGAPPRKR